MSKKFVYIKVPQTSSCGRQRLLIQHHFTCVLTLCFVFVGSWKKPSDDRQQSAPFSIFLSNICYASEGRAIQVRCV
jgi:hypothetical protein